MIAWGWGIRRKWGQRAAVSHSRFAYIVFANTGPGQYDETSQKQKSRQDHSFSHEGTLLDAHIEGSRKGWCEESENVLISEQWSLWEY